MARGSIVWRCWKCGLNTTTGRCDCLGGKYYAIYYVGDKQKWQAVGKNKHEAEKLLHEIQSQANKGLLRELPQITFKEFVEGKWLPYIQGRVKPLTLRSYRTMIECDLIPALGEFLLTDITPEMVKDYVERTAQKKRLIPKTRIEKQISARTVNHSLVLLKQILNHAKQWGYLRENSAAEIKPLRVEKKEQDYLKPDELLLVLGHAQEPMKTLIFLAVCSGMRLGELLGLQWEDIDWSQGVIRVKRSIFRWRKKELVESGGSNQQLWAFSSPKYDKRRLIWIRSQKLKEMLELLQLSSPKNKHDFVFATKHGTPLSPRNVYRKFQQILEHAGLRKLRFHDLRGTYEALEAAAGSHLQFIKGQMGHSSITTTVEHYGHLLPMHQLYTSTDLDEVIFGSKAKEAPAKILLRNDAEASYNKDVDGQNQLGYKPNSGQ